MITIDQLNPRLYPREYWINVYFINGVVYYGMRWESRFKAESNEAIAKVSYRIHVRLK